MVFIDKHIRQIEILVRFMGLSPNSRGGSSLQKMTHHVSKQATKLQSIGGTFRKPIYLAVSGAPLVASWPWKKHDCIWLYKKVPMTRDICNILLSSNKIVQVFHNHKYPNATVDGRNPARKGFTGLSTSQVVVWDFFHLQKYSKTEFPDLSFWVPMPLVLRPLLENHLSFDFLPGPGSIDSFL